MLSSGTEVPFGVCVWSTGNTALDFVRQLGLPLSRDGRILVDAQLAVQGAQDVYAMGDCAVNPQEPLPMIAQVIKCLGSWVTAHTEMMYCIQFHRQLSNKPFTWESPLTKGPAILSDSLSWAA